MKTITILALIAILAGATTLATTGSTLVTSAVAQATDNATMAGNLTGGNLTGGNTTDAVGTVSGAGRG
jgi:xanthosine utilization system XapX-like protein